MEIGGRTFLVAPGGSGPSAATAHTLAREGANVVVADLKGAAEGENVRFVETDVTEGGASMAPSTARCGTSAGCTGP
jgi:NAD(P)-dependent dehydrogenase (short-subunit alcohol dehydrogenase family)